MQQAIPYRSWRPLHNPTSNFTPQVPLNTNFHNIIDTSNNNNNSDNNKRSPSCVSPKGLASEGMVLNMVSENAIIVFGRRGCCMSHVVKRLLLGLGVNPGVYEVEEKDEVDVARELEAIVGNDGKEVKVQFPAVFIGGKLFGGLDRLMATHISGELVPMLKEAGALWL